MTADTVVIENQYAKKNNNNDDDAASVPHSGDTRGSVVTAVSPVATTADRDVVFSPELLQMYYARLFPFDLLHTWLSYGSNNTLFQRREFSFTLDINGEEMFLRYQSFANQQALAQAMLKRRPIKFDIGAVYEQIPDKHASQTGMNKPAERELIFDIDLTDYDGVRNCGCTGAAICGKCWEFMKLAVQVMDCGLRRDFGFEHIGWFYSGRRGVHAWVCDEAARALTDEARSAVVKYFEINMGSEKNKKIDVGENPLHPMMTRAFEILEPAFVERVLPASGHGILATPDKCQEFLEELPPAAAPVREKVSALWAKETTTKATSPAQKWDELKSHLTTFIKVSSKAGSAKSVKSMTAKERDALETWPVATVFRYTYPRLDINVSKMRNHLLKSPFCVHPKTGRVCVPIRAASVDDFDPFQVPTVAQIVSELDQYEKEHAGEEKEEQKAGVAAPEWKKTSLKQYFEPFQKEFLDPMLREQRRQQRDEAEQKAALMGDF